MLWNVLSEVAVTEDDLRRAADAITAELGQEPAGGRGFNARADILRRLFGDDGNMALAVNFRLQSLGRLADHPQMRAWTVAGKGDEADLVPRQSTIFAAAAAVKLTEIDGEIAFDPESFFAHALSLAADAGKA